jgi:hypothetical protein
MMMRLEDLPSAALYLGMIAIVGAIVGFILVELQSDIEADYGTNSTAYEVTEDGQQGIAGLTDNLDIIGLVLGFGIVLAVIAGFGYGAYQRFF